ncbi:MAG: hypothetical protein U5Q44_01815 [Dehalococcoidia bacterium]|nr:hypothetical protein [Dehalococcoidia bacterium]
MAYPPCSVTQEEAARCIGLASGQPRRAAAIARASGIATRASVVPPEDIVRLGTIEERNAVYRAHAPGLSAEAARAALDGHDPATVGCLVTSSCTGYALPGWGTELVPTLGLPSSTARVPLTESGCAGGVVALARAADYVRNRPGQGALTVATELCSLAFHADGDDGNLTSSMIFGDGAGAALLTHGDEPGLDIIDSASMLVPASGHALGFDLTDRGFYPVLDRHLADIIAAPAQEAVRSLLDRNGLSESDVAAWLLHPGGARILQQLEAAFCLAPGQASWSWASLRQRGKHLVGGHLRCVASVSAGHHGAFRLGPGDWIRSRRLH